MEKNEEKKIISCVNFQVKKKRAPKIIFPYLFIVVGIEL